MKKFLTRVRVNTAYWVVSMVLFQMSFSAYAGDKVPELKDNSSRIYIELRTLLPQGLRDEDRLSIGSLSTLKGDIFVDGQQVMSVSHKQVGVIDIPAGVHRIYWVPRGISKRNEAAVFTATTNSNQNLFLKASWGDYSSAYSAVGGIAGATGIIGGLIAQSIADSSTKDAPVLYISKLQFSDKDQNFQKLNLLYSSNFIYVQPSIVIPVSAAPSMPTSELIEVNNVETPRSSNIAQKHQQTQSTDAVARLGNLKKLLDKGLITSKDYEEKKKEILKAM